MATEPPESGETLHSIAHGINNLVVGVESFVGSKVGGTIIDRSKFVSQEQRFELWATSMGVYLAGHSSLDYRLRDAPLLLGYTKGLLQDLERDLRQLIEILQNDRDTGGDGLDAEGLKQHFHQDDDSEDGDFASDQDQSLDDILAANIEATIDKLYRLAFSIRNPAMRLGFSKASRYRELDPETGVDLIDQYTCADVRHLQELFASWYKTSPEELDNHCYLIQRLAKANTRRRQQFRYWKKRRNQFEIFSKPEFPVHLDNLRPPSQPSTATKLDVTRVTLDEDASMISTSSFVKVSQEVTGDLVSIPPSPMKFWDKSELECPYCFTLCPKRMLVKKAWETHILRDLRPYVCTYKDCREPDQLYDSLTDWINHEAFAHGGKQVREQIITTSPDHIRPKDKKTLVLPTRNCPFCQTQNASPYHVGSHLQRIACFSLPRSAGEEDYSEDMSGISGQVEVQSRDFEDSAIEHLSVSDEIQDRAEDEAEDESEGINNPLTMDALEEHSSSIENKTSILYHIAGQLMDNTEAPGGRDENEGLSGRSTEDIEASANPQRGIEPPDQFALAEVNDTPILDSRYKIQPKQFFTVGRVFSFLWHENAGSKGRRGSDISEGTVSTRRFREPIYSGIRRMVVVKESYHCAWCLPVNTYSGDGVAKPDVDPSKHAIFYMRGTTPYHAPNEPKMTKEPIEVDPATPEQKLDPMSRVNFGKVYTVEHNVKVLPVGRVSSWSMAKFMGHARTEFDNLS